MNFQDDRPIFLQLAEQLEDSIVFGTYPEETQVPSITEYSVSYKINPATALKGVNLLVDEGILYKKRGIGMFVSTGARKTLLRKRRDRFYHDFVEKTVREAVSLELTPEELDEMIRKGFKEYVH